MKDRIAGQSDAGRPREEEHMRDALLRRMDELGCSPDLRSLVAELPATVDVVLSTNAAGQVRLAGAANAVPGVYVHARHFALALDPEDAGQLTALTGVTATASNPRTHHVKVDYRRLQDEEVLPILLRYSELALTRSAGGRGTRPVPGPTQRGAELDFPCVVLRVNRAWREGMDVDQVYDVTHGWWVMGQQREQAEFAVAVAHGVVRGVFRIHGWRPRHLTDEGKAAEKTRWGFDGEPSPDHDHLIGLDVRHLFRQGDANPVRYLNLRAAADEPSSPSTSWESSFPQSDRRAEDLRSLCERLRDNPVLHLSLTSKELFHSNLLGWLFELSPAVAVDCLGVLAEPDARRLESNIRREAHHLDLIVELPGFRPVVIENKVFSLPDEAQLDDYAAKNIPAAGARDAVKVLLSLSDPGWLSGSHRGWTWLPYETAAARLVPAVEKHLAGNPFVLQLVRHWADMIRILQRIADLTAPSVDEPLVLDADAVELLRPLRLHDAFQKFRTRRVRHLLEQHLAAADVAVEHLESGFTNDSPLLSGRVFLPDGAAIGWQLQGAQWRRFVITPEAYWGKTDALKLQRIAYAEAHHRSWFSFEAEQALGPFAAAPSAEYKHYAPDFLYDYVRTPGVRVQQVLEMAETVLREASAYRASWPAADSSVADLSRPVEPPR